MLLPQPKHDPEKLIQLRAKCLENDPSITTAYRNDFAEKYSIIDQPALPQLKCSPGLVSIHRETGDGGAIEFCSAEGASIGRPNSPLLKAGGG